MASADLVTLAGQLNAVRRKTRLWGDKILAGKDRIPFPIELTPPWAYFHSGHGEETAMDHVARPLLSMVPVGSAYMTNVKCGEVTMAGTDDYETILFFSGMDLRPTDIPPEKRIPPDMRMAFLEQCIHGVGTAIAAAPFIFHPPTGKKPDAPNDLAILTGGQPFITSHFIPYFTYEKPFAPGNFIAMQSGLFRYGTPELGKEKAFKRYDEDILHFMYDRSVFPTFQMVMDSGVKEILNTKGPNRDWVEGHLSAVFRCSSEALMLRFPGFHAHTVCRTPIRYGVALDDESNKPRVAKTIAREMIAAFFHKKRTPFFPLIQRYADTCPWADGNLERPADPADPRRLRHPDAWEEDQREYALEWAQQEYFKELAAKTAAGGAGAGGGGAAGGAGGGGAKRQRTLRNRRSRRQRKTRRNSGR